MRAVSPCFSNYFILLYFCSAEHSSQPTSAWSLFPENIEYIFYFSTDVEMGGGGVVTDMNVIENNSKYLI